MINLFFHYTRDECGCNFTLTWNPEIKKIEAENPSRLIGSPCRCQDSQVSFLIECYQEMLLLHRRYRILDQEMVYAMEAFIGDHQISLVVDHQKEQDHE